MGVGVYILSTGGVSLELLVVGVAVPGPDGEGGTGRGLFVRRTAGLGPGARREEV